MESITRMEREITHIKILYPDALCTSVADSAVDNWPFLNARTTRQATAFLNATEYLADAAPA